MAEVLDALPSRQNSRYPWTDWFDGQVWEITHGEDFFVSVHSMRCQVTSAAARRGYLIETRTYSATKTRPGRVVFQATRANR